MRRDKLDRAMQSIKQVTPHWYFRRCWQCTDDVKGERMWRFKKYYSAGIHGCSMCVYTCLKCAPTMADLIEAYPSEFKNVDVTPLREEDERLEAYNNSFPNAIDNGAM